MVFVILRFGGIFCIGYRHTSLHADRDFDPMQKHLGLKVA